jgi:hypothetical protein
VHLPAVGAIVVVVAPTITVVEDFSLLAAVEEPPLTLTQANLQGPSASSVAKLGTLPLDAINVLTLHLLDLPQPSTSLLKPITLPLLFLQKRTGTRILVQHTTLPATYSI